MAPGPTAGRDPAGIAAPDGAKPLVLAFYLPHLHAGGLEKVVLNFMCGLDRGRVRPVLILGRREGSLLELVPPDVDVRDLGGKPARKSVFLLARHLRDCGADIVYSGTNATNYTAILAGAVRRGRTLVIASEHTTPSIFLRDVRWRRLRVAAMRLLYPRAAAVAVPLAEVGDELREILGLPNLAISVQPNPVITGEFADLCARTPEIPLPPPTVPLVAATGRLDPAKGFDVLLRAMAILGDLPSPPHLVIMGAGQELDSLRRLAHELGVQDRVQLAGHVRNPFAIMKRAAVAVMSSRREGFGNVLVEAMACGVPVVSTDCPVGPRVILEGGKLGVLVPPEDPAALAGAIAAILKDPQRAAGLRAAGLRKAAEYEVSRTVRIFQQQVEALAGRR